MKRCPKCKADYFDEMLEFCLEDGAKLFLMSGLNDETPTITKSNRPLQTAAETISLPFSNLNKPADGLPTQASGAKPVFEPNPIRQQAAANGLRILEFAPVIIALAHNWWQWVYLQPQYYSTFSGYVLSANFLMWLLLLVAGIAVGLFSVRYSANKSFAYTSLVILAINLLLFLVPRR